MAYEYNLPTHPHSLQLTLITIIAVKVLVAASTDTINIHKKHIIDLTVFEAF